MKVESLKVESVKSKLNYNVAFSSWVIDCSSHIRLTHVVNNEFTSSMGQRKEVWLR
jgi:hypothetical protein